MARKTAAIFGYTSLILQLLLGWLADWDVEVVLVWGLAAMLIASLVGWTTASLACEWTLDSDPSATSTSH
ncbi:MAG: hypothetical protein ACKOAU_02160 [Pirellula sp.]|jgi:hypothetical protein